MPIPYMSYDSDTIVSRYLNSNFSTLNNNKDGYKNKDTNDKTISTKNFLKKTFNIMFSKDYLTMGHHEFPGDYIDGDKEHIIYRSRILLENHANYMKGEYIYDEKKNGTMVTPPVDLNKNEKYTSNCMDVVNFLKFMRKEGIIDRDYGIKHTCNRAHFQSIYIIKDGNNTVIE